VYDITKRPTFEHLEDWLEELRIHILPRQAIYAVVGHKADMAPENRVVSQAEARRFAVHHGGLHYFETSAKTGENIEELFTVIARDVYSMMERGVFQVEEGWDGIKPGFSNNGVLLLHRRDGDQTPGSPDDSCC